MPELPEVENIKLGLEDSLKNKKILSVTFSDTVKRGHELNKMPIVKQSLIEFSNNVVDKKIIKLTRRGKYLYLALNKGYIITHFGMTGAYFIVKDIS